MQFIDRWQDIQIDDAPLWNTFKQLWDSGQYANAISLLSNAQFINKWDDASKVNALTSNIVELEKLDDKTFRENDPITSRTEPQNPKVNQLWFKIYNY